MVSGALMGKWGDKSKESCITFALRIDQSDAPSYITGSTITLWCFKGRFDRENPEVKKENEYEVLNFVRP